MDEKIFLEKIKELTLLANSQGNVLSKEQVLEALGDSINESKLDSVIEYLKSNKIGVEKEVNLDDYLSDDERDYLKDFEDEIAEYRELSDEAKESIFKRVLDNDSNAKIELISVFLPLVVDIAKLYTGQGVLIEDLIGEGNMALAISVDTFECNDNYSEASEMASKLIISAMEEAISERFEIEEGDRYILEKISVISKKAEELFEVFQREITLEELEKELDYTKEEMRDWIDVSGVKIANLNA